MRERAEKYGGCMANGGPNSADDRELMNRIAQGDVRAFEWLYETYFPQVTAFLDRTGCARSEDLTQEVFLRVWAYRRRFGGRSGVKTYLMGIAKNVRREWERRWSRWPTSYNVAAMENAASGRGSSGQVDASVLEALERAKSMLTQHQREAVELVYRCEVKPSEAAAMAGCSYKAMRRRLEEARKRLRELLAHCMGT